MGILGLIGVGVVNANDATSPTQATKSNEIQSFDKLFDNAATLAKHPGADVEEVKRKSKANNSYYKIKLKDTKGIKWEVKIDAVTGQIISDKQDS